jgi:hypothetical protein
MTTVPRASHGQGSPPPCCAACRRPPADELTGALDRRAWENQASPVHLHSVLAQMLGRPYPSLR